MKTCELPEEIWLQILDFAPDIKLRGLYQVNRVFLQLFLDERYRKVSLIHRSGSVELARKHLLHLLQPHILPRIRCLEIKSLAFKSLSPGVEEVPSRWDRLASRLPSSLGALLEPKLQSTDIFELCRQVISQLPASTISLHILGCQNFTREFFEVTTFAWTTLAKQLTQLSVTGSWHEVAYIVKETSVPLPCLESLELINDDAKHCIFYPKMDPDAKQDCAAFLEALAPSLRCLSIDVRYYWDSPLYSGFLPPVFDSLGLVPALRSLRVTGDYSVIQVLVPSLLRFIRRIAPTLEALTIPPYTTTPGDPKTEFSLNKLRHLTMSRPSTEQASASVDPASDAVLITSTAAMYVGCSSELTALTMNEYCLMYSELAYLLSAAQNFHGLRGLDVTLVSINPQLFSLLASALPNLLDLKVSAHSVLPNASKEGLGHISRLGYYSFKEAQNAIAAPGSQGEWYASFESHNRILWTLEYLTIFWAFEPRRLPVVDNELKGALRRMIPSLKSVLNTRSNTISIRVWD